MLDLGTLGGTLGFPNDLNNAGQVIGQSNLPGDLMYHPFLWEKGRMLDLGTFGGNGYAAALNDAGEVVGQADLPGDQMWHGFLWRHGVMTDLGTVVGDTCSGAIGIGSKGQVVGASGMCFQTARAPLWENGGPMIDLNALIPPNSDLHLSFAENINDRGEIAGIGVVPGSGCADVNAFDCGHAFLLIPCDEKHQGVCEDNSMIEVPTQQTSPSATMTQGGESAADTANPLRNRFGRGFHIPGQPAASRD